MGASEKPKMLFNCIKAAEIRFKTKTHKFKDEEKITMVLSQAPLQHKAVLTSKTRICKMLGVDVAL